MLIGSVQPFTGKKMLLSSVEAALKDQENTLMIFTGAPQNSKRSPLNLKMIKAGKSLMAKKNLGPLIVHAPYLINLANAKNIHVFNFSIEFLQKEILRAQALGATQIVLHPGSHVGAGYKTGLNQVIKGLNEILTSSQKIQVSLETMAGKGTEVGTKFEHLAYILDHVTLNNKLSITIDTCHLNDAGYPVKENFENVLQEFDEIIGLKYLKVIHLNDAKYAQGCHKDRHANIGLGTIGFTTLNKIAHLTELENIPKILETPSINGISPYSAEIKMLRTQKFMPEIAPFAKLSNKNLQD